MDNLQPTGLYRDPDVQRETDRAVQVATQRSRNSVFYGSHVSATAWLPKSQIEFRSDVYGEQIYAPAWLIRKAMGSAS